MAPGREEKEERRRRRRGAFRTVERRRERRGRWLVPRVCSIARGRNVETEAICQLARNDVADETSKRGKKDAAREQDARLVD